MNGDMLCRLVNTSFDSEFKSSHLSRGQLSISNSANMEHLEKVILLYSQLHKCRGKKPFGQIQSKPISKSQGIGDYF